MEFKNYGKADTNDGLIPYQDLMGLHEFTDDAGAGPIEPFEDFRGKGAARRQGRKIQRMNVRNKGKLERRLAKAKPLAGVVKKAQDNRAKKLDIQKSNSKANIIAAKNAGKSDPAVNALLNQQVDTPKEKSNTGLYVGIGVGVVVLAVGAYLLIKKPWKKK